VKEGSETHILSSNQQASLYQAPHSADTKSSDKANKKDLIEAQGDGDSKYTLEKDESRMKEEEAREGKETLLAQLYRYTRIISYH
jgi:hypothetical protein